MDQSGTAGERFHPKALPILLALLLGVGLPVLTAFTVEVIEHFVHLPERPEMPWIADSYERIVLVAYTVLVAYLVGRRDVGEIGIEPPAAQSYVFAAVALGVVFGLVATLFDYGSDLLALRPPADKPYPLTAFNIGGWLSYGALLQSPSEELLFRGLLVSYLAQAMPGRVVFRGYEIGGAGIVAAAVYALYSAKDIFTKPLVVVYAFLFGLVYAYWYEKSRSLLAPIVGHSLCLLTHYALVFALVAALR